MDAWELDREPVIKATHLSRKPAPKSASVALGSVLLLFVASMFYWSDAFGAASLLPASRESVFFHGEYWRLVTSLLVHADWAHFLSNAVVLGVLAFLIYGYYGPLAYPALMFVLGALVTAISLRTYPAETWLLGASGVVYLMAGFWLTLYLLVERRVPLKKRFVRAVGFGLIVLVPTAVEPAISYRTHMIGFVVGFGFALVYFSKRKDALRASERIEYEYH